MVQIAVHNNNMEIVDYISNDVPGSLHYYDDLLEIYTVGSSAVYEFTVDKYRDGLIQDRLKFLTDDAYISFEYDGDEYLMTIRKLVEDDYSLTVYAETFNLELLNEIVGAFTQDTPVTFEEAIGSMGFLTLARLEIGKNEIQDITRTFEFTTEETMFSRILALVETYNAEINFVTTLKPNGELDKLIIDIYKARTYSNPDDGIGNDRKDIRLYYGRDVEGVRRTIDKTELFTALRVKDSEGNFYKFKRPYERLNDSDKREIFVERNSHTLYAPISMRKYPSVVRLNNCDNWIVREKVVDIIDDEETMWLYLSNILASYMYPKVTYEIDLVNDKVLKRYNIKKGDTIYISDENFLEYLIVQARVSKLSISFSNPSQNKITLSNFMTIKSQISDTMMTEMRKMAEDAKPYSLNIRTDNGLLFKEYKGTSTVTPELLHGKDVISKGVTYVYYINGVYNSMGPTFTISPTIMTDEKCVVTIEAIYGNDVVATAELTFFNVNDGKGITGTVITYGLSSNEAAQPATWSASVPTLVKGQYLWTKTDWTYTDSTTETGYTKTYIAKDGNTGKDGVGITSTTITYAVSSSGTTVPTSGWTSAVPSVSQGQYLWTKTFWTYTDSTSETGYSVARMGADGQTPYVHWAYSDNADGAGMSTTDTGQRYIGNYSDYTQADSTDKTKYRWADRWAKIEVGGVNQIPLTGALVGYKVGLSGENAPDSLHTVTKFIPVKYSNYVLSYDGELDSNPNYYYSLAWYSTPDTSGFISCPTGPARQTGLINGMKLTPPANATYLRVSFPTNFYKVMLNGGTVKLNWSKSPEDIEDLIDSKADQDLTLAQKRELEERMGVIESELKARALLQEMDAWFEEYTKYKEGLATDKSASETKLTDLSNRIDAAVKDLGDMSVRWNFLDTYMKAGNEGLMIGKMNGTTSIRVSDNRIAFYSGGKEVAFISNDTLEIENGIFTTQLQVGRFQTSQYGPNPDANIVRYVG